MGKKWTQGVEVKAGKLGGWEKDMKPGERRRILAGLVKKDGYATVVQRLNFLVNASQDKGTQGVARSDMKWLQEEYGG